MMSGAYIAVEAADVTQVTVDQIAKMSGDGGGSGQQISMFRHPGWALRGMGLPTTVLRAA
jgi:hypothetical protein